MKCRKCGAEAAEGQRYCVFCGEFLEPHRDESSLEATDKESNIYNQSEFTSHGNRKNLPIMLLGLATIAIIVFALISSKSTVPSQDETANHSSEVEMQTDVDDSKPDEEDATVPDSEPEKTEQQIETRPAAFSFVGQPLSALFQVFGEDYESFDFEGGTFLYYPDVEVSFGFPWNEGIKEDTIITTIIARQGEYPLYATVNANMTYDEIKKCLEAEGTRVPEPEGYQDQLNDQYVYSSFAQSKPGKINISFVWWEDPYTTPVSEVVITQGTN